MFGFDSEQIKSLRAERKKVNNSKKTAEKRKKAVDKAKEGLEDMSSSDFNKNLTTASSALKKGLSPLKASFDVALPGTGETEALGNESYELGRRIYRYQSTIDDLDYQIKNLQIEEG